MNVLSMATSATISNQNPGRPGTSAAAPDSYRLRQAEIAAQATGPDHDPVVIAYTDDENRTWADAHAVLAPIWRRFAAPELRAAKEDLDLPTDRIPQLALVSSRLERRTGFRYASVPGTVPGHDFFGALARSVFSSTQFIRWSGAPEYTPEPDLLHEVGGHAISLAHPPLAELHRLAGVASRAAPNELGAIAAVFWYTVEFGVVASPDGWKAYGAGLLSSPGELGSFATRAEIRSLDIEAMIATPYDINRYQPVLFGADSIHHVYELVADYYTQLTTN